MSDPKRMLDESSFEGGLLRSQRHLAPPVDLDARILAGLGAKLPASALAGLGAKGALATKAAGTGTAAGTSGAAAAKVGTAAVAITKAKMLAVAIAIVGSGAATAVVVHEVRQPSAVVVVAPAIAPKTAIAPAPAVVVPTSESASVIANEPPVEAPRETLAVADLPTAKPVAIARPAKNIPVAKDTKEASEAASSAQRASEMRGEALALRDARDALARGDVAAADAALAKSHGAHLAEERDALAVRAAAARGDGARARSLGEAFLATYPSSPLGPQIAKIVASSKKE